MAKRNSMAARAWRAGRTDWRLHLLSIFSVSVAFLCLGSALLVVTNLQAARDRWARVGRATVYLRDGADPAQVRALHDALNTTPGLRSVRFSSSSEVRHELLRTAETSPLQALPDQAFPAVIDLDFPPELSEAEITAITSKIGSVPVVESVDTYGTWSERLGSLFRGGLLASVLLATIVLGAVVSVVASTMRLALERRRTEIEVLQLVGATARYVRGPFLVEGAVEGTLGATAALGFLWALHGIVRSRWDSDLGTLLGIDWVFLSVPVMGAVLLLGTLLGTVSSLLSLRRLATP